MSRNFEYWQTPHWTNRCDYPASGDALSDWRWRWEFLRRDEGYQRAWQAGTPIEYPGASPNSPLTRMAHPDDLYRVLYVYKLANLFNPCFDASRYHNIFSPRTTGLIFRWAPPNKFLEVVEELQPTDLLEFFRDFFREQQEMSERIKEGSIATAIFDLYKPLPQQLKKVEYLLKAQQKHQSGKPIQFRKHQDLWPVYLRLLDAEHQGNPKAMKIHEHLMDEAKQQDVSEYDRLAVENPATLIADWQSQAKKLRDKAVSYL